MAQRGSEGTQRPLGVGPGQPGSQDGGQRARVELDGAQVSQVERDDRRVAVGDGVEAADHARSASVGNDGHPGLRGGTQHGLDRGIIRGAQDGIGSELEPPGAQPDQVRVAAARRPAQPILGAVENLTGGGADGVRDGPCLR